MMVFITFMLTFAGLVTYMPSNLYKSGYQSQWYDIPTEFDAWSLNPSDYGLSGQLLKTSFLELDFTPYFNTTQKVRLEWHILFANRIDVYSIQNQFMGSDLKDELEDIRKSDLIDGWTSKENYSHIIIHDYARHFDFYFEDYNGSRNNIESAWNDGKLNVTCVAPSGYSMKEYIGAREIIVSLLTFRLPSIFTTLHPLFGFVISIIFYIPIAFIFFYVMISLIHGD